MSTGTVVPKSVGQAPQRTIARLMTERPVFILLAVFVIFYVLAGLADSSLFTVQGARGILLLACPLAMLAGAQTVCMLTGGIDMSVSMVATLAAYVVVDQMGSGPAWAILAGVLTGAAVGIMNGIGVGVFKVSPMIMTLGLQTVLLGVITVGAGASGFLDGSRGLPRVITGLSTGRFGPIPANTLLLVVVGVLLVWLLSRTGLGRNIYAVGDNPIGCRLAGIQVWKVLVATYMIAGILAALGGMMIAGMNGSVGPDMSNIYLLPSVAAAVIGGTSVMGGIGGYGGTIVGCLILTVLNRVLLTLDTSEAMRQFIYGLIVLALAWVYTRLTGSRERSA